MNVGRMGSVWLALLVCGTIGRARAEVDGEGNIMPTGNVAVDAGVAVVNKINESIREVQDLNRVFKDRDRMRTALEKRREEMTSWGPQLKVKQADVAQARKDLERGKRDKLLAAGSDDAQTAQIEKDHAARVAELDAADAALKDASEKATIVAGLYPQMSDTLTQVGTGSDAAANWEGGKVYNDKTGAKEPGKSLGLKGQFMALRGRLEQRHGELKTSFEKASTLVGKSSSVEGPGVAKGDLHAAFSADVVSLGDGRFDYWVNGRKLEKDTKKIAIGEDRKVQVRAMFIDPRRKQSKDLQKNPPANVTVDTANDYKLAYHLGARASSWAVIKETYTWDHIDTRTNQELVKDFSSSGAGGKGQPENDTVVITLRDNTASETLRIHVVSDINWKNGPTENPDTGAGDLVLQIYPAR